MLSVYLICVGKLKEKFYQDACAEYIKRLSAYCRLTLVELPEEKLPQTPSQGQIDQALAREAAAIRAKLPPSALLAALCVEMCIRDSFQTMAWSGGSKQSGQRFTLLHPPAQSCTAPFVPAEALLRPFHIGVYLPASTQLVVSSLMQPKALHVLRRIAQKQADLDRKSTRLNSSHSRASRMPSSA